MSHESSTAATPVDTNSNTNLPERKVSRYVKIQPGYLITFTILMMLILNTFVSACFTLYSYSIYDNATSGPQRPEDAMDIYDVFGLFFFLAWNTFMWTLILLVPSMTTVNREKVKSECVLGYEFCKF